MTDKQTAKLLKKSDSLYFKGEKATLNGKLKKGAKKLSQSILGYEQVFGTDKLTGTTNFAQALVRFGNCMQGLGQIAEAHAVYTRAIQVYAGIKNKRGVAMASTFLARLESNPEKKHVNYERAFNIYNSSPDLNQMEKTFQEEAAAAMNGNII